MLGGMDSVAVTLFSIVVEFGIYGNEKQVEAKLALPSLPATILFNNKKVKGQHQGLRGKSEGVRSVSSMGLLRYAIEANGMGQFISEELSYSGNFLKGKFHDTSGTATCSIGKLQKYTGGFDDGHLSGPGKMENFIDGEWRVTFRGTYEQSKPWTGAFLSATGEELMTVRDGAMTSVGGGSARGDTPPAGAHKPLPPVAVLQLPLATAAACFPSTAGPTDDTLVRLTIHLLR